MCNLAPKRNINKALYQDIINSTNRKMNNPNKNILLFSILITLCFFSGCKSETPSTPPSTQAIDTLANTKINTAPAKGGPDNTIYGIGDEFGMSTFSLKEKDGTIIDVTRVAENGEEGKIFGSTAPGMRYAMTLTEDEEALETLINISELELFTKDYYIYNGNLILTEDGNQDWVDIEKLSDKIFIAKGKSGKTYTYQR